VQNVKKWVEAESQHKKEQPMDWSGWDCGGEGGLDEGGLDKTMVHEQCPTQHNGFDCGCALCFNCGRHFIVEGNFGLSACMYVVRRVFMCQNARHVASHAEPADFPFSQQDMPSIRWQMVHEILNGALSN
jgi:Ulp1 family protease